MATLNDGNVGMGVGMSMPVKWDISLLGDFYPPTFRGDSEWKLNVRHFLGPGLSLVDPEVCSLGGGVRWAGERMGCGGGGGGGGGVYPENLQFYFLIYI